MTRRLPEKAAAPDGPPSPREQPAGVETAASDRFSRQMAFILGEYAVGMIAAALKEGFLK